MLPVHLMNNDVCSAGITCVIITAILVGDGGIYIVSSAPVPNRVFRNKKNLVRTYGSASGLNLIRALCEISHKCHVYWILMRKIKTPIPSIYSKKGQAKNG